MVNLHSKARVSTIARQCGVDPEALRRRIGAASINSTVVAVNATRAAVTLRIEKENAQ